MREIKFRAWDKESRRFISTDWKYGGLAFWENIYGDYADQYCDIQQFTGLTDKNGVEIYEGDIVSFYEKYDDDLAETLGIDVDTKVTEVKYSDLSRRFEWYGATGSGSELWEVIGNIYENPELLEDKE